MQNLWDVTTTGDRQIARDLQAVRQEFFALIAPKGNWKLPIDAWIDADKFEDCNSAAVWFTGGALTFVGRVGGKVHVTGRGYYHHVGA